MSLAALVFRNLAVAALLEKTLAADNVRSSDVAPVNEIAPGSVSPGVTIFTDAAKAEKSAIDGLDLLGANIDVTLAIEIACTARSPQEIGPNGEVAASEEDALFIPETDEGLEMTLDIIQRQAIAELQTGEGDTAALWRRCVLDFKGINVMRGAAVEHGVRFAARRIEIVANIIGEPYPGTPLSETWAAIIAAMKADAKLAKVGATVEALAGGVVLPPWKQWRNQLGLNDDAMTMIGVGPIAGQVEDDGDLVEATELAGEGLGATIMVDAEGATMRPDDDPDHPIALFEVNSDA